MLLHSGMHRMAWAVVVVSALYFQFAIERHITRPPSPGGIVPYELAFSCAKSTEFLIAWKEEGQHLLRVSLLVDWFVFMGAYGTAFVGVTLWFAHNQIRGSRMQRFGRSKIAWLPPLAVLFDVVENAYLWWIIGAAGHDAAAVKDVTPSELCGLHPEVDRWAYVAAVCAAIKFGALVLTVVYWLAAWCSLRRQPPPEGERAAAAEDDDDDLDRRR